MSWLGILNFVVLQWFGVRLARVMAIEQTDRRVVSVDIVAGGISVGGTAREGRRVQVGWKLLRWIVPLTGWWSDYRWIARRG